MNFATDFGKWHEENESEWVARGDALAGAFDRLKGLADELPSPLFEPVVDGVEAAGVRSVKTAGEALLLALVGLATSPPLPPSPQRGEGG